jgi:Rod binding domain-containing protein
MDQSLNIDTQAPATAEVENRLSQFKSLENLSSGKNLSEADKLELAKASRGFESMFINLMLKEMKSGMLNDEDKEDGLGGDTILSYTDMMYADHISKIGEGIGIAQQLYEKLTGGEKLPTITVDTASPSNSLQYNPLPDINSGDKNNDNLEILQVPSKDTNSGKFIDRVKERLENYNDIISSASENYGVPKDLIKAVITAESAGKSNAKSGAGAKGLMQLMDGTAQSLGVNNSYDPAENIMGGTKYLKMMLDKFGNSVPLALAAYNAGPGNVEKHGGVPPFTETQSYIRRVNQYYNLFKSEDNKSV